MADAVERIQARGFTWLVAGTAGRSVVAGNGPDVTALTVASAQRVKTSPVRTVWRVGPWFVKDHRLRRVGDRLRAVLVGSKAWAEWRAARRLRAAGVPTIEPAAVGWRRRWGLVGRCILVTRAIVGAAPLTDLLRPGRLPARARRAVIQACAHLLRQLHQAGIEHRDLYADNLLVEGADAGRPVVHVIDLHRIRFSRRLGLRARRRNLVLLATALRLETSAADRWRFFRAYAAGAGEVGGDPKAFVRDVMRRVERATHRFWARRDRRCLKPGKYFGRMRNLHVKALMVAEWDNSFHRHWLQNPAALMAGAEVVKAGRSATVVRAMVLDHVGRREVYIKRYNMWKLHQRFQRTRAMRAYWLGHAILNRGLPTPVPLAAVNRRWVGPVTRRAYLITEAVPGGVALDDWLRDPARRPAERRAVAAALGRLMARMHRAGFSHPDLKLNNILVTLRETGPEGAGPDLHVIDLDGARRYRRAVPERPRVRALARLWWAMQELEGDHPGTCGRAECGAFLDGYLGPGADDAARRAWCARAEARMRRLATVRRPRRDGERA